MERGAVGAPVSTDEHRASRSPAARATTSDMPSPTSSAVVQPAASAPIDSYHRCPVPPNEPGLAWLCSGSVGEVTAVAEYSDTPAGSALHEPVPHGPFDPRSSYATGQGVQTGVIVGGRRPGESFIPIANPRKHAEISAREAQPDSTSHQSGN